MARRCKGTDGNTAQSPLEPTVLPEHPPEPGDLVQVRSRRWLVERVEQPSGPGDSPVVHLACADDDAQGQELRVYWDYELDRRILKDEGWDELGRRGFDAPRRFAAFFHTLLARPATLQMARQKRQRSIHVLFCLIAVLLEVTSHFRKHLIRDAGLR